MINYKILDGNNYKQISVLSQKIFKNLEGEWNEVTAKYYCNNTIGFGAFDGDILIGYIFYGKIDSSEDYFRRDYTILYLGVDENYRRNNIGYILAKCVINSHKGNLYLQVRVDNINAIKLYYKLGFIVLGILKNYYRDGSSAFLMRINTI